MSSSRRYSSVVAEQDLLTLGGVPINRMTWRVVGKGERYIPNKRIGNCPVFDIAPPPLPFRRKGAEKRPENMLGRRIGRMTVVGYWGPRLDESGASLGGAENQRWVCRCPCGLYTIRTAKTIKKAGDHDDKCEHCRHLAYLMQSEQFRRRPESSQRHSGNE